MSWGEGTSLKIGKYFSIATNVIIFLGSEHRTEWISAYPLPFLWEEAKAIKGHPRTKGDVVTGNDVWIGCGFAVGACSLIVLDVPPYAIVAGNPARIIRHPFDEGTIEKLLMIKWWNWREEAVAENVHRICSDSIDEFIKKFG